MPSTPFVPLFFFPPNLKILQDVMPLFNQLASPSFTCSLSFLRFCSLMDLCSKRLQFPFPSPRPPQILALCEYSSSHLSFFFSYSFFRVPSGFQFDGVPSPGFSLLKPFWSRLHGPREPPWVFSENDIWKPLLASRCRRRGRELFPPPLTFCPSMDLSNFGFSYLLSSL